VSANRVERLEKLWRGSPAIRDWTKNVCAVGCRSLRSVEL
jgi:hypothetical protein